MMNERRRRAPGFQEFGGRVFLTQAEHEIYLRRAPVRYSARGKQPHAGVCEVWGDRPAILGWAHKGTCSKSVRHICRSLATEYAL